MANEEAVQRIAAYLRAYRGVYEEAALREQALQQGYTAEDIDEALRRLSQETAVTPPVNTAAPDTAEGTPGRRFWLGAGWAFLTAFALMMVGIVVPLAIGAMTNSIGGALAVSLLLTAVTLFAFAFIPQRRWRNYPQTRRALLIGYAVAAIPLGLLLIGFGGLCLTLVGFA
ncbi:hypothetical protein HC891_11655 [Candidatus Gracilibacteria bacterium]|nr:hypothetical protein [Candidatus Gracilibacteria bacterium]